MMVEFAHNLADWFIVKGPLILWAGLLASLLFATVHLLTMLITSWGDRKASSKSLLFSLLIHLCCALGVVVINPPDATPTESQPDPEVPIPIRNITFEGNTKRKIDDSGNTPVWEKPPKTVDMELTRLENMPVELQPLISPERNLGQEINPELHQPDLPSLPDRPLATPLPENRGVAGPVIEAARMLNVEAPTAEARREVVVPSPNRSRQKLVQTLPTPETIRTPRPTRGDVDRVRPEFEAPKLLATIDANIDPRSMLKRGPTTDSIDRRAGPAPSGILVGETGEAADDPSRGRPTGGGNAPTTTKRLRSRSPVAQPDGRSIERYRPARRPQSPSPQPGPADTVRIGTTVSIPSAGAVPNVRRSNFDSDRKRPRVSLPATYQGRDRNRRKDIVFKAGGTEASERAVELSLRWLAAHQTAEGYWNADQFGSGSVRIRVATDEERARHKFAGKYADTGVTALAVLAFLAKNYTHEEGEYAENVERALLWLIRQQGRDGYLGGQATYYATHYCHAMATYALAEAYAMQSDPTTDLRLREPIRRAVAYIVSMQNPTDGGWRYVKGQKGDMSMFGWQLMALKSAELGGIPTPEATKNKMIQFLKDRSLGRNKGLAGYQLSEAPTPTMTAEALFCKQMLGITRDNPASTEAATYLLRNLPRRSRWNLYYWYYGNLAMFQYSGQPWREWNEAVRDVLVAEQIATGPNTGSWDPKGPWGPYGGRVYSTAMAALCLEVYARYLPLYQMGDRDAARTRTR
jgi:hypothetical protein